MIVAFIIILSAGISQAADEDLWTAVTEPDALIVLDLSGSMEWVPHGRNPTFYSCGSSCNEPYYETPQYSGVPSKLYVAGNDCSINGPFTINAEDAGNNMPTSDLYVAGTSCDVNGPFRVTQPLDSLNLGEKVYISTDKSCGDSGPFYPSSGSGHTKECFVSGMADQVEEREVCVRRCIFFYCWNDCHMETVVISQGYPALPSPLYISNTSNCTTGPFYRTSAYGRQATCNRYTKCNSFENGYTETDCINGPFWRQYGYGHTTPCGSGGSAAKQCDAPSPAYTETNCTTGPFYRTSGTGHTTICRNCIKSCAPSGITYHYSDTASCEGPFYSSSNSGARTDCSKIAIAKRAIFELFDDTSDDSITSTDVTSLGMRIGFMRYLGCGDSNNNLAYTNTNSCVKLSWGLSGDDPYTNPVTAPTTDTTPYANIYCNDSTCASTVTACTDHDPSPWGYDKECVAGYDISGGTPIGNALNQAKNYLAYHKGLDAAASCRQKSIILITDGEDTFSCNGNGSSTGISQRRAPIYWAKQAADYNFKTYVVGFGGDMPTTLQDTLNWAAYYGQTRNPNATQSGDTNAVTVGDNPCNSGTDPSGKILRGYAFMAANPQELVNSIRTALSMIHEANYSFSSQASVAAARVQEENYIYEVSFDPKNNSGASKEPFWTGHLKKYQIGDDGSIITPHCWDAGVQLRERSAADRNMWTLKNGYMTSFDTANITAADLAVATDARRNEVVGFYRGEPAYNLENWKLGDLFHTNPVAVKTPSKFFFDPRECSSTSFNSHRSAHERTAMNGNQVVIAGGNDGQLHAFRAGNGTDCTSGGEELWSFIPPNLLQKIAPIAHNSHTDRASLSSHDFFIDGPLQVSDVWLPASWSSGTSKSASDWKTIVTFTLGQGSGNYLWSRSSNCYSASASDFSATYDATNYPYYCGLHAINVTSSTSTTPTYLWHLMPTSSQAPYLGQAWSKMQTGRIKVGGEERWVGFVGGGYNAATCSGSCNTPATGSAGKGFYVVDLRNGNIIWSYTRANNANMIYSFPASPLPLDLDNDQFIDTVYLGDLGGNMWRFRLCAKDANCSECGRTDYTSSPCTSCTTSDWTGSLLFTSTNAERGANMATPSNAHKQIFTMAQATYDDNHNLWIFFGTGENNDPTYKPTEANPDTSETKNRLYAVKEDPNFTATYSSSQLENITSSRYTDSSEKHGWYINLSTNPLTRSDSTVISNPIGEKMISDPAIFGGMVYYATYVPDQEEDSACGRSGDAFLYKLNYKTGAGGDANPDDPSDIGTRTSYMGHGIGSSILISYAPQYKDADIYATASGGAGTGALTQTMGKAAKNSSMTNVLYWRDRRLQ